MRIKTLYLDDLLLVFIVFSVLMVSTDTLRYQIFTGAKTRRDSNIVEIGVSIYLQMFSSIISQRFRLFKEGTEWTLSALVRPGWGERDFPREDSGLRVCLESDLVYGDSALGRNLTTRPSASSNTKHSLSTYSLS